MADPINQEQIDEAAEAESDLLHSSPEVIAAKMNHLNTRVVLLRARVNQLEAQLEAKSKPAKKKTSSTS